MTWANASQYPSYLPFGGAAQRRLGHSLLPCPRKKYFANPSTEVSFGVSVRPEGAC